MMENWVHVEIHFVYEHSNIIMCQVLSHCLVCVICSVYMYVCMYVCMYFSIIYFTSKYFYQIKPNFFSGFVVCCIGNNKNVRIVIVYDLNE